MPNRKNATNQKAVDLVHEAAMQEASIVLQELGTSVAGLSEGSDDFLAEPGRSPPPSGADRLHHRQAVVGIRGQSELAVAHLSKAARERQAAAVDRWECCWDYGHGSDPFRSGPARYSPAHLLSTLSTRLSGVTISEDGAQVLSSLVKDP